MIFTWNDAPKRHRVSGWIPDNHHIDCLSGKVHCTNLVFFLLLQRIFIYLILEYFLLYLTSDYLLFVDIYFAIDCIFMSCVNDMCWRNHISFLSQHTDMTNKAYFDFGTGVHPSTVQRIGSLGLNPM